MNPLYTCSSCFRHIKGNESTCPFVIHPLNSETHRCLAYVA